MKKILITGRNSFIGTSVKNWLLLEPSKYSVDTLDMKGQAWKQNDFSSYDVVFHVAGIAHISANPKLKDLYFQVNRDLAIETAQKAKFDGVKQFIFMSSIIVYGESSGSERIIDINTIPTPSNYYGDSKLQADEGIRRIESENFKVVILRPPMIYGKGSKGNYPKLVSVAKMLPIFPDFDNQRSMLHIDNFCEFVKVMIDHEETGLFFPQNTDYVETSKMVKLIREVNGKRTLLTKKFNWIIRLLFKLGITRKLFGNLVYEKSMSDYKSQNYRIRTFKESIELTEK
ncbi:MAG: NAD-dependent epimerase/dehydratase family protein [Erysipelotrichaceae bacterium]|nr:NAD-dependent epimerase/dehydratase family protein [Erysipelotrichaceae bacterium]